MDILYMEGDPCAPKYLGGALKNAGLRFDQIVGKPLAQISAKYDIYILSDFSTELLERPAMKKIIRDVGEGSGLLMVGGWASFGRGGYARTPLADVLPVTLIDGDDRVNYYSGLLLEKQRDHPIVEGLELKSPVVICGYNAITPKAEAEVILQARKILAGGSLGAAVPILMLSRYMRGRTAALATDLTPHWSGGLTDWGAKHLPTWDGEEVGDNYVQFIFKLVQTLNPKRPGDAQQAFQESAPQESVPFDE